MRKRMGSILFGAIVLGLVLPIDLGPYLTWAIWTELFVLIFLSYFQVDLKGGELKAETGWVFIFYLIRFGLLPIGLYFLILPASAFYATGIFLLVLAPGGITAPALTGLFGGRIEVSMLVLGVSSLLSPLAMPWMCQWVLGSTIELETSEMLQTLLVTLVLPFLLHLPLRKSLRVMQFTRKISAPVNIVMMGLLAWMITGKNQELILSQPLQLLQHALILTLAYGGLYGLAYLWRPGERARQIGYSVASGANNIALVMALGYTYFSPEIGFFFVAGVIIWTLMLIPVERLLRSVRGGGRSEK